MEIHSEFMRRCLQLAELGRGFVSPNPMVGAVLVYEGRIIGEGYHQQIGGPHAEVNAISSVAPADLNLISEATLYVSLEPCNHHGKTPPCSDLVLKMGIRKVVIATLDPFIKVNGTGYTKLKNAGVEVVVGVLEEEAKKKNERFFCNQKENRPYIVLKWAQTKNGLLSAENGMPLKISCDLTNRLVHKWRSEEDGICVGLNTVRKDDPQLNNRLWSGKDPIRIIFDPEGRLPDTSKVLQGIQKTIVFTHVKQETRGHLEFVCLERNELWMKQALKILLEKGVGSMLVEGGAITHKHFIETGMWDEARIIVSDFAYPGDAQACTSAPILKLEMLSNSVRLGTDVINYYHKKEFSK